MTPVPFMVVTLASGFFQLSLPAFIAASVVTRGGRFFLGAGLMQHPHAKAVVDRHLTALAVAGAVLIVLALLVVKMLEHHVSG